MMIICQECGFGYDETQSTCPECGNPTPRIPKKKFVNTTGYSHCPHCGAPVTDATCEWCGCPIPTNADLSTDSSTEASKSDLYRIILDKFRQLVDACTQKAGVYAYGYCGNKQIMRIWGTKRDGMNLGFFAENGVPTSNLAKAGFVYSKNQEVWVREFGFAYREMAEVATEVMTEAFGKDVSVYFEDNLSPVTSGARDENSGTGAGVVGGIVGGVIGLGLGLLGLDD